MKIKNASLIAVKILICGLSFFAGMMLGNLLDRT
jgi:hypothetical protein